MEASQNAPRKTIWPPLGHERSHLHPQEKKTHLTTYNTSVAECSCTFCGIKKVKFIFLTCATTHTHTPLAVVPRVLEAHQSCQERVQLFPMVQKSRVKARRRRCYWLKLVLGSVKTPRPTQPQPHAPPRNLGHDPPQPSRPRRHAASPDQPRENPDRGGISPTCRLSWGWEGWGCA